MTKYFVDSNGKFLGGFDGKDVVIPNGAIEVPTPNHGLDTWDNINKQWNHYTPSFEEKNKDLLDELLEIDLKSIRALREGDQVKINEWEGKAVAIRAKFKN